jgi:hypothetical protein
MVMTLSLTIGQIHRLGVTEKKQFYFFAKYAGFDIDRAAFFPYSLNPRIIPECGLFSWRDA